MKKRKPRTGKFDVKRLKKDFFDYLSRKQKECEKYKGLKFQYLPWLVAYGISERKAIYLKKGEFPEAMQYQTVEKIARAIKTNPNKYRKERKGKERNEQ